MARVRDIPRQVAADYASWAELDNLDNLPAAPLGWRAGEFRGQIDIGMHLAAYLCGTFWRAAGRGRESP